MALHRWFHCCGCGSRYFKAAFVLQFPDERGQLPSYGDDTFVFIFSTHFEFNVALVQSVLHSPREAFNGVCQVLLPSG